MKVDELKASLDSLGVKYSASSNKQELRQLLEESI
jgi:hypothetical protein